jgi:hypothetical protein
MIVNHIVIGVPNVMSVEFGEKNDGNDQEKKIGHSQEQANAL